MAVPILNPELPSFFHSMAASQPSGLLRQHRAWGKGSSVHVHLPPSCVPGQLLSLPQARWQWMKFLSTQNLPYLEASGQVEPMDSAHEQRGDLSGKPQPRQLAKAAARPSGKGLLVLALPWLPGRARASHTLLHPQMEMGVEGRGSDLDRLCPASQ